MIMEQEGCCVALDSTTSDLLELYTLEFNKRLRKSLEQRECPHAPEVVEPDELGRRLLQRLLMDWFQHEVKL